MDLSRVTTFGPVVCPACQGKDIVVVSQATHTSDAVYHGDSGYVAWNSDASWGVTPGTEEFRCGTCAHSWPVDKEIWWEWDD